MTDLTLVGAAAGQPAIDMASLSPFSGVTLTTSATSTPYVTSTVALSSTANGALSDLGIGVLSADGSTYTVSGSPADVQAALRGLVFTPAQHEVPVGQAVTTGFTLTASDAAGAVTDTRTSVVATAADTPPTVTDTSAMQPGMETAVSVQGATAFRPFVFTTIADPDAGAMETTGVTLALNGAPSDAVGLLSGTGLTKTGVGTYTLATASPAAETVALQALAFTPANPGTSATLGVTLTVSDGAGAPVTSTTSLGLAGNPGTRVSVSNSNETLTTYTDTPVAQTTHTYATNIEGVLDGATVVYDRTFNLPYSDPQVQAAVAQAQAAVSNAGGSAGTAALSASNLVSQAAQTSTVQTGSTSNTSTSTTTGFGPTFFGPNTQVPLGSDATPRGYYDVVPGQTNVNIDTTTTTNVCRTITTTSTDLLTQQYLVTGTTMATAAPTTTTLVSSSAAGVEGNSGSQTSNTAVGFTADGTSVLFTSTATNLAPGTTDSTNLFLKNTVTGAITLITTDAMGLHPNSGSDYGSVDGDGNLVAFSTYATNIDARANDDTEHVFIRNVSAGTLTLIAPTDYVIKNAVTGAIEASTRFSNLELPSISGDGRYVAVLAGDGVAQGSVVLVLDTLTHTGVDLNNITDPFSNAPAISRDGSTVVISTTAMLQPAGTQPTDMDAKADIYAYNIANNIFQLVSDTQGVNGPSVKSNGYSAYPSVSSDGTYIAFASQATNFDSRDTDLNYDVYVKNLTTGQLVLADVTAAGVKANSDALTPSISADGAEVAFESTATNLVAGVTDGNVHVYVKNLTTGELTLLDQSSAGAAGNMFAQNPILSPDGTHAAFFSGDTNLVANDTNGASDVFLTTVPAAAAAPPANTPPTITGVPAVETDPGQAALNLFAAAVATDPDAGQTFTVRLSSFFAESVMFGGTFSGGGFTVSPGAATFSSTSIAAVQAALQAVSFTPNIADAVVRYSISDGVATTNGSVEVVSTPAVAPVDTPPTITGVPAVETDPGQAALQPFAAAVATDPDAGQTFTVEVVANQALNGQPVEAKGGSFSGGGFTYSGGAIGTFSSTSITAVQAALRAVAFTPSAPDAVITYSISDGSVTTAGTVDVLSTPATPTNTAPVIGGTAANQPVTDKATVQPFATATITDPDAAQTETVTVTYAAANGTLAGAGFTGSGGTLTGSFTGAGAGQAAAAAQAALEALVFTPTANEVVPPTTVTTGFGLSVSDGAATATNAGASVVATSVNDPPVIGGTTAGQADTAGAPINPFATATVADPDTGQPTTVTVSFAAGAGTLSGGGFVQTAPGVYSVTEAAGGAGASAAAAQADLRAAVFTPTAGQSATTTLTVAVSDGQATATSSGASVTATFTAPAPGGGGGGGSQPGSVVPAVDPLPVEFQNLERALLTGVDALTPGTPVNAAVQAFQLLDSQYVHSTIGLAQAEAQLLHMVDGTTAVAVADYAFFTGFTPTAQGLDYLVHSAANATDLNDPYYARFSTENRYINFAVNLATGPGAGAAAFAADYGSLSLADATSKAYLAVFGTAADATKVAALLNTLVPDGLGGQETRSAYFAQYGGDGPNGQGAKAAMIGFLLANAVETGAGVYGASTEHYLAAIAHGQAPAFGSELALTYGPTVNLVGSTPIPDPTVTG